MKCHLALLLAMFLVLHKLSYSKLSRKLSKSLNNSDKTEFDIMLNQEIDLKQGGSSYLQNTISDSYDDSDMHDKNERIISTDLSDNIKYSDSFIISVASVGIGFLISLMVFILALLYNQKAFEDISKSSIEIVNSFNQLMDDKIHFETRILNL